MTAAPETLRKSQLPWGKIAWFGLLMMACYAPVLRAMVGQWGSNPDMGHGFFVPVIAGYIVWQKRNELAAIKPQPNWWGLAVVILGAVQLIIGTLGVELFLSRTSFVIVLIGAVWLLGGDLIAQEAGVPAIPVVLHGAD